MGGTLNASEGNQWTWAGGTLYSAHRLLSTSLPYPGEMANDQDKSNLDSLRVVGYNLHSLQSKDLLTFDRGTWNLVVKTMNTYPNYTRTRSRQLVAILMVALLAGVSLLAAYSSRPTHAASGVAGTVDTQPTYLSCRYGTTVKTTAQKDWLDELGAGWFINHGVNRPPVPPGIEYMAVIWVEQDEDQYGNYLPTYWTDPRSDRGRAG